MYLCICVFVYLYLYLATRARSSRWVAVKFFVGLSCTKICVYLCICVFVYLYRQGRHGGGIRSFLSGYLAQRWREPTGAIKATSTEFSETLARFCLLCIISNWPVFSQNYSFFCQNILRCSVVVSVLCSWMIVVWEVTIMFCEVWQQDNVWVMHSNIQIN